MNFIDLYQQRNIRQAHRSIAQVASQQNHQRQAQRDEIGALHDRIDRLTLLCEALWELTAEATGYTDEDLEARLGNLDLADGVRDRRRAPQPNECGCGAMVHPQSTVCIYCGEKAPSLPSFSRV